MWLGKSLRTKTMARRPASGRFGSSVKNLSRTRRLRLEPLEQRAMLTLPVSGAALWLDASVNSSVLNGSGVQATNGQTVGTWNNIASGASGAVTQSTDSSRPTYVANSMHGNAVVHFAGVDDVLTSNSTYSCTNSAVSAFIVLRRTTDVTEYPRVISFIGPDNNTDYGNNSNWCLDNGQNGATMYVERVSGHNQGSLPAVNTPYLAEVVFDGANCTTYINGSQLGSTFSTTGSFNINSVAVGAGWGEGAPFWNFAGDIAEVVIYNSALNTTDRQATESYLNSKWIATASDYTVSATQDGSADAFRLVKSGTNIQVYVNSVLNQTIPLSGLGRITVNGSNDADTLTIDSSGGIFTVPNGVTFNAGSGTDTLVTQSQTSNGDVMNVTPTGSGAGNVAYIAADGTDNSLPIVTYSGVENITLTGQAGEGDTFTVDGSTGNDVFTVNEGAATGGGTISATLNDAAYSLPAITFSNMSATVENLINSSTLTNGGGIDTLTFNCTSSADTITATPGFLNGMYLAANTGGDRLKIRADNMAAITVACNDGNDTINLSGGAKAPLTINGGNGTDAIHISNSPDPDVYIDTGSMLVCRFGTDQVSYSNTETIDGAPTYVPPSPPVAGAAFWMDASTLNLAQGAAVTSVSDLSGNGNNLVAVGTGATFNVNPLNGLGTIHLSSGTNYLQTISNLGVSGNMGRSWFAVMRYNTGNRMTVYTGAWSTDQLFGLETSPVVNCLPSQYDDDINAPIQPANTFQVYEAAHDSVSGNTYGWMNGALQDQIVSTLNTAATPLQLGFCNYGYTDGDIAEVLAYNRCLTDAASGRLSRAI